VTIGEEAANAKEAVIAIEIVIDHDGAKRTKAGLVDAKGVGATVGVEAGLVVAFPMIGAEETYHQVEKENIIAVIGAEGWAVAVSVAIVVIETAEVAVKKKMTATAEMLEAIAIQRRKEGGIEAIEEEIETAVIENEV
jgi:hypothetical protein